MVKKNALFIIAAAVMVLVLLAGGCSAVRTYNDPWKTIDVKAGEEFTIALESNPTTGYEWEASFDEGMLTLLESSYKTGKEAQKGLVGAGGTQYFHFKAGKSGKTEITLTYKRPWETESAEQKVFTVEIN